MLLEKKNAVVYCAAGAIGAAVLDGGISRGAPVKAEVRGGKILGPHLL